MKKLNSNDYMVRTLRRIALHLAIYLSLSVIFLQKAYADAMLDAENVLKSITCETQAVVNIGFDGQYQNTCVPDALSNMFIASILSPGEFIAALAYTKMNNPKINVLKANCNRANRANPYNPTINFAFCSDVLLAGQLLKAGVTALEDAVIAIASGSLDAASAALNAFTSIDPDTYHVPFREQSLGSSGVFFQSLIPIFWSVVQVKDKICVAVPSIFGGSTHVGCKYMSEPFPVANYHEFMGQYASATPSGGNNVNTKSLNSGLQCSGAGSCYLTATQQSKILHPISGPLVFCMRQMLVKAIVSNAVCSFDAFSKNPNAAALAPDSTFFHFQSKMRNAVTAFLILYTIFFGMNIILSIDKDGPKKSDMVMFPIKIILVLYFSVGINMPTKGFDGMTSLIFPFLLDGTSAISSWVTAADSNAEGLCDIKISDYPDKDSASMLMWDVLDCRIASYLGINALQDTQQKLKSLASTSPNLDSLTFSVPPWMYLLVPAVYSANIDLVILALTYPILVISVAAYVVNSVIVAMIGITILGILAPLFVPMYLFEYTKGHFDSWVKLLISFVLQPMVIVTFMMLMFSLYDHGLYQGCKYTRIMQEDELGNTKIAFTINNDPNSYGGSSNPDFQSCQQSLGWMLNSPSLAAVNLLESSASGVISNITNALSSIKDTILGDDDSQQSSSFTDTGSTDNVLASIGNVAGMFMFGPVFLNLTLVEHIVISFLCACFLLYIMYHVSSQIANFAADITEGIAIDVLSIKPQTIMQKASFVADKMKMAGGAFAKYKNPASLRKSPNTQKPQDEKEITPPPSADKKRDAVPPPSADAASKRENTPPPSADKKREAVPPPSADVASKRENTPPPSADKKRDAVPPPSMDAGDSEDEDENDEEVSPRESDTVSPPSVDKSNEGDGGK